MFWIRIVAFRPDRRPPTGTGQSRRADILRSRMAHQARLPRRAEPATWIIETEHFFSGYVIGPGLARRAHSRRYGRDFGLPCCRQMSLAKGCSASLRLAMVTAAGRISMGSTACMASCRTLACCVPDSPNHVGSNLRIRGPDPVPVLTREVDALSEPADAVLRGWAGRSSQESPGWSGCGQGLSAERMRSAVRSAGRCPVGRAANTSLAAAS